MTVRTKAHSHAPGGGKAGRVETPTKSGPVPHDPSALAVLDDFPALIWRAGRDARCDYFNKAWLAFTGRRMEQELGDGWSEGVHPDERERCVLAYLEAFRARAPFVLEYRLRHHEGEYRWIRDIGRPYFDFSGEFSGYIGGCFDLTEHKHDESLLKLQFAAAIALAEAPDFRAALQAVIRLICDLTGWQVGEAWLPDPGGKRLVWSGAFYSSISGIDRFIVQSEQKTYGHGERFMGRTWEIRQPAWRGDPPGRNSRSRLIPGGGRAHCAIPVTADGEVVAIMSFFSQTQQPHDQSLLDSIAAIAMKLGMLVKRKRVELALRQSEQQLRQALHARERLMQDLHDNTVQAIYAVGMGLEECQQLIDENPARAAALLQHAIGSLNGVIRGLRGYISGREPQSPRGPRLRADLVRLAREFGRTGPLRFRVKVDPGMVAQVTAQEAEQILSIAREAMSNAVRHSRARHGALSLCRSANGVRLDVSDDGAGFEPRTPRNAGSGLCNMELRAREIGARIELVSAPGHGTRVMLTLPERPASDGPS